MLTAVVLLAVLLPIAWLNGYRHGYDAMRHRAVSSLRFAARLRNTIRTDPQGRATSRALNEAADRLEAIRW